MWQTPKTDWTANDVVLCSDYNRIKGNIDYLQTLACKIYKGFDIEEMGDDKTEEQYPYADEYNRLEQNIEMIAKSTAGFQYGESPVFFDNGNFLDYQELNRIERATLDMYNQLTNQYKGRRMLTFTLGAKQEV